MLCSTPILASAESRWVNEVIPSRKLCSFKRHLDQFVNSHGPKLFAFSLAALMSCTPPVHASLTDTLSAENAIVIDSLHLTVLVES